MKAILDLLSLFVKLIPLIIYGCVLSIGYNIHRIDFSKPLSDQKNLTIVTSIQNSILILTIIATIYLIIDVLFKWVVTRIQ